MEKRWFACGAVILAVGCYDYWAVRAVGYRFEWGRELSGYYDYLGRAFAHGRLSLPIEPRPELLALKNPYDPVANEPYRMHDMVFYRGRYYLYHGAGPAVLFFAPWRLLTGHDLPENFALFAFCFGGYLFWCAALIAYLAREKIRPGPWWEAGMLLALGTCSGIPYLLSRVWVYEVAIGAGYFCIAAATFFLVRGRHLASGLMFGMAIACRPHLGVAGLLAMLLLRSRALRRFAVGFGAVCLAVAAYNYVRFGNPAEFGLQYLLCGPNQNRVRLAWDNLLPGLYYFLGCSPEFGPVFPWARLVLRNPFNSPAYPFPPEYFIEGTVGALYLAPLLLALVRRIRAGEPRVLLGAGLVVLLFLAATGFTTQRYMVDFLPMLLWVAAITVAAWQGPVPRLLAAAAIAFGAVIGLALGISGPYDEMLRNRPAGYVKIAGWFSPIAKYRPIWDPRVEAGFTATLASNGPQHEPLFTMGRPIYRYLLSVDRAGSAVRIASEFGTSRQFSEVGSGHPLAIQVKYAAPVVSIWIDGALAMQHEIGPLVTTPDDVAFTGPVAAPWKSVTRSELQK